MSRLVKLKGPKFWRGPQATKKKKKSLCPTTILWLCHQTEPHFRQQFNSAWGSLRCPSGSWRQSHNHMSAPLLSRTRDETKKKNPPTNRMKHTGLSTEWRSFQGRHFHRGLPSRSPRRGATPLGATATPSTNRKQGGRSAPPRGDTLCLLQPTHRGKSRRIRRAFTC